MPDSKSMRAIYQKRAKYYDFTANLFYLIGFREWAYRKCAVTSLNLGIGDTVVELGCGTGLNFSLLHNSVGPTGKIIGVDFSEPMLEQARARIKKQGWTNIELIESDARSFEFPTNIHGVLATFSIKAMPGYEGIIAHASTELPLSKRLVVLDLQRPEWCPDWLREFVIWLLGSFGANSENANYQPWDAMQKYFNKTKKDHRYFDVAFIAYGEK